MKGTTKLLKRLIPFISKNRIRPHIAAVAAPKTKCMLLVANRADRVTFAPASIEHSTAK